MKRQNIIFLIFFILLTFLPVPVFSLFREQIGYKNTENKAESPFPDLNSENYSTWPRRFEEWFSDNLPFKTQFIELFRGAQLRSGLDFTQSNVIRGSDRQLFYRTTIENYKGLSRFTNEELEKIKENLKGFFRQMEAQGAECLLYIAPDKEQVYSSSMPARFRRVSAESRADQAAAYLREHTDFYILYPKTELTELSKTLPVYYNTDTHWNNLGGWAAYEQVRSAFSGEPVSTEIPAYHYYEENGKDLANMLGLSEQIPEENGISIDYNDGVTIWKPETVDHGTLQRFVSDAPVHKKMLLIGDSFSEYFMRSAIHELDEIYFVTYGEMYRIDPLKEAPDLVVVMLVERNLPFLLYGF